MLVIARRQGEAIHIADDVRVVVLEVRGKSVKLAIEAPGHVKVLRAELLESSANQEDGPANAGE